MKMCGRHNVRKHKEIKDSDKYITLDILLKFVSLKKIRIISSEPKDNMVISGKGMINSMCLKTNVRSKKYKKARYDITDVSVKDISNMMKEFKNYLIRVM